MTLARSFIQWRLEFWRSALPCWAVMTAVREAEPSVERSAADRRAAAQWPGSSTRAASGADWCCNRHATLEHGASMWR